MANCRTILIVDSDHDTRVLLRKTLEESGHFVISTGSGVEALEMCQKMTPPSLVLLAPDIPIMTAKRFISLLREVPNYGAVAVSQIARTGQERITGTCCEVKSADLALLLSWLENPTSDYRRFAPETPPDPKSTDDTQKRSS